MSFEEPRSRVELSCGLMAHGVAIKIKLNAKGKFEAVLREGRKDHPGKTFDDVDEAVAYGWRWKDHFDKTGDKKPI